jgi:hypothetical protein
MNTKHRYPFVLCALALLACASGGDESTTPAGGGGGHEQPIGGAGGGGTGGAPTACTPGATEPCYEGPDGTEGLGPCRAGEAACLPDGSGYGACEGQVLPGDEDVHTPGDENCDGSPSGELVWDAAAGSLLNDYAFDAAFDGAGNLIVVGNFAGTIDFGGGSLTSAGGDDLFIAKYDPTGALLWSKRFGGADDQQVFAVAIDAADAIVVTGRFKGTLTFGGPSLVAAGGWDAFLAKLDGDGTHLGSKLMTARTTVCGGGLCYVDPTGTKTPLDLVIAPDGRIAVVGTFDGHWGGCISDACDDGGDHGFVRVYDPGLNLQLKLTVAGPSRVTAASFDPGGLYIGGAFRSTTSFAGNAPLSANGTDPRAFVAHLDDQLAGEWSRSFEGGVSTIHQGVTAITALADGGVAVTGRSSGPVDVGDGAVGADQPIFIARYDATGALVWGHVLDGTDTLAAYPPTSFLAEDSAGDLVTVHTLFAADFTVGGETYAPALGAPLVLKLDSGGAIRWVRALEGSGLVRVMNGGLGPDDRIGVAGTYSGTFDFGLGPHGLVGVYDTFAAVLYP